MRMRALGPAAARALTRFNDRHPWSHNAHFHGWVLRRVPTGSSTVAEIGCGRGELAVALSCRSAQVIASDTDPAMREATLQRAAALGATNVLVGAAQLPELPSSSVDAVVMVAVLHHLPLRETLQHVSRVLAPGGRFLCVGLTRRESHTDTAWEIACAVSNPVIGVVKHPHANHAPAGPPPFPVRDPQPSLREVRAVAREDLPGARVRRREAFRYTLEWTRPPSADDEGGERDRAACSEASVHGIDTRRAGDDMKARWRNPVKGMGWYRAAKKAFRELPEA